VAEDGTVRAGDMVIGQLMVVDFAPGELRRAGPAYFTAEGLGTPVGRGVHQGYLELSNAQLTEELTTLLAVHRAYQASQTVLATIDATLERAAGELGRFGG
jgi:flagellar basal-body rod protein FlgF